MLRRHRHSAHRYGSAITFLEGDPDQPLISGCLYHKENQDPYPLSANKTRTVFKTLSSRRRRLQERRIEDKKSAEQISSFHAQKDWDENIEHDQKIRVGNERHDTVEKNTYTELKAEELRTTHSDRKVEQLHQAGSERHQHDRANGQGECRWLARQRFGYRYQATSIARGSG